MQKAEKFVPLNTFVLVEPTKQASSTESGIILNTDTQTQLPSSGKIVKISDDISNLATGDTVLFNKYSGAVIKIDNTEYHVLKLEDLYGYFPEEV